MKVTSLKARYRGDVRRRILARDLVALHRSLVTQFKRRSVFDVVLRQAITDAFYRENEAGQRASSGSEG